MASRRDRDVVPGAAGPGGPARLQIGGAADRPELRLLRRSVSGDPESRCDATAAAPRLTCACSLTRQTATATVAITATREKHPRPHFEAAAATPTRPETIGPAARSMTAVPSHDARLPTTTCVTPCRRPQAPRESTSRWRTSADPWPEGRRARVIPCFGANQGACDLERIQ